MNQLYGRRPQREHQASAQLDQMRLSNMQAGLGAAEAARGIANDPFNQALAIEAQRRGIPLQTLAAQMGIALCIRFNAANSASPTLNADGLGAKAIQTASGVAMTTGAILANSVHTLTYDNSIPAFLLQGHLASALLAHLDITGGAAETSPAIADEIPLYDASANANRKMTLANSAQGHHIAYRRNLAGHR